MGEVFDKTANSIFNDVRMAHSQLADCSNEELLSRLADDEDLLNYFISKNETLIWSIIYQFNFRYQVRNFWQDDSLRQELFQIGLIKFYECIKRFSPKRGRRFSTFVYKAVHNSLISYCFGNENRFRFYEILSLDGDELTMIASSAKLSPTHNLGSEFLYQSLAVLSQLEQAVICIKMDLNPTAMLARYDLSPFIRKARALTKNQFYSIYSRAMMKLKSDHRAMAKLTDAYECLVA